MPKFADVIVPVPVPVTFTYIIPEQYQDIVKPLMRVVVPFGKRKYYTAVVCSVRDAVDVDYELKEIFWVPDTKPVLRRHQLQLWNWMADYYMCAIGDVYRAALPAGLKVESETIIEINPDFEPSEDLEMTRAMTALWEELKVRDKASVTDLEKAGLKDVMASVYALMEIGAVSVREKLTERFRPKFEEYYTVTIDRADPEALQKAFSKLRSPRQERLLMSILAASDFTKAGVPVKAVAKQAIADNEFYDRTALKSLEKKGFIKIEVREVSRFKWDNRPLRPMPVLSRAQKEALDKIHSEFVGSSVVLLHGVTSSGKTEIYIHLCDYILRQQRQVLLLVPEIALTTQLTKRLQNVFGPKVIVYHSRFSDAERAEIWKRMVGSNEPVVVIGARSSVFLPFVNLGLVIVDEEHEPSYKQFDPAPRYNARDVATVLSKLHGAKTLLASATPSVETYFKALNGRYGLVTLSERYGSVSLPEIEVVDTSSGRVPVKDSLADVTVASARAALDNGEQVIFFHNRRGFSPIARCKSCEFIPKCTDCDVSLSYHKRIDRLVCHYCGKEYMLPQYCPSCQQPTMEVVGFGTERVEDAVAENFPTSKIVRMDLDTTRNKENYSNIIDAFSEHKADILVGTQMVTKGLDFGDVTVVAVLNADLIINYPDFRSAERAFNMLEQVSGRAGRRADKPGKVLIQTRNTGHPVIRYVLNHDYTGFYEHEIAERKAFAYPPFSRLIYIFVRHKDENVCREAAESLASQLTALLGNRVLGPHEPAVNRVKTFYIRRIMVKIEPEVSVAQVKNILRDTVNEQRLLQPFRSVDYYFDVDPL